ncbi:peptide ABC transporter substrate-binding protein [Furfurilactobacillus siliginis]|nr:peptide ABC transporter substrate-binding protein [Furfurilactobacillus siliginis]GEK28995.1 peptide ABC transporter substrate-binding protein [Furfurilactobacillus siliginis]
MKTGHINKGRLIGLLAAAMVATVTLTACGSKKTADTSKGNVRVAATDALATLNSSRYSDVSSGEAIQNSIEGLYRIGSDGKPVLAGAKTVKISDNQRVYTFKLRANKWSNGDDVTAANYVYAWRKLADPTTGSPNSQNIDPIANGQDVRLGKKPLRELGVKALDKQTLQVTLANPVSYLKDLLTTAPYAPQDEAYVKKQGKAYGTDAKHAIYNGPFTVTGWTGTNDKWTFTKNKHYWDAKAVKVATVSVTTVKSQSTAANLYQSGKLDYFDLTNEYVKQYKGRPGYHVRKVPSVGYLNFNTKRAATANVHIRRALATGFNKNQLTKDVLQDGSTPLNGIVPADFVKSSVNGEDFRKYSGNLVPSDAAYARKEFKTGLKELGKQDLTLEFLSADTPEAKAVAEFMQSSYEKTLPGLKISVREVPLKQRLNFGHNYQFDIVYGLWSPDYQDPYQFITDGGAYHLNSDYKNPTYLKVVKDVNDTYATNPTKRWEALRTAEHQIVKEDAFTAPVFQGAHVYMERPSVKGLVVSPNGSAKFYRGVTK